MTMTNNPTIDGVLISRQLAKRLTEGWNGTDARIELRALLDVPAVERQEPVARCRQSPVRKYLSVELLRTHMKDGDLLYSAPPEVAALQSTIARLEARITQLESEKEFAAATYQAARDRIAELESGRGEPVAWMCFDGEGNYDFTEDPETAEAWRKSNGEQVR